MTRWERERGGRKRKEVDVEEAVGVVNIFLSPGC
jgi:hypothetical protein